MEKKTPHIIGVIGSSSGVGVTYFSVALANYISKCLKRKVILIEYNEHEDLKALGLFLNKKDDASFKYQGVMYCKKVMKHQLIEMIEKKENAVLIMDMGCQYYKVKEELEWCHLKIVVGSLVPWKKKEYVFFLKHVMTGLREGKGFVVLTRNGNRRDKKDFKEETGYIAYTIPEIQNVFQVSKKEKNYFSKLYNISRSNHLFGI